MFREKLKVRLITLYKNISFTLEGTKESDFSALPCVIPVKLTTGLFIRPPKIANVPNVDVRCRGVNKLLFLSNCSPIKEIHIFLST